MTTNTLKRKLSKAYDEGKLDFNLTQNESMVLGWSMAHWQAEHSRNGFAEFTLEQYARAQKKRIIDLCLNGAKYTIK